LENIAANKAIQYRNNGVLNEVLASLILGHQTDTYWLLSLNPQAKLFIISGDRGDDLHKLHELLEKGVVVLIWGFMFSIH